MYTDGGATIRCVRESSGLHHSAHGLMENVACSPFSREIQPLDEDAARYVRNHFQARSYTKERCVTVLSEAWTLLVNQNAAIKKLKEENERLSSKVIVYHEEVISLHREIKNIREKELEGLGSVVERAVDTSVKRLYSEVTNSSAAAAPVLDSRAMGNAIQDASEADEKARNVIVFGLPETVDEVTKEKVGRVFDAVGEKPQFELRG